jgi:hypothetical protein
MQLRATSDNFDGPQDLLKVKNLTLSEDEVVRIK